MCYPEGPKEPSPAQPLKLYTPAVDFMENQLAGYHKAFDMSGVEYDDSRGQFVALHPASPQNLMVPDASTSSQPRPLPGPVIVMKFWDDIFPVSMGLLKSEANYDSNSDKEWCIRHLTTWEDVQDKLEKSRHVYDFESGSQNIGRFRSKVRNFLDSGHVIVQQGTKIVPNSEIAAPIVGVINLMMDAYSKAAEVRNEVMSSLESLPGYFEKIDLYLQSYPQDENIIKASVGLVLAVFKAVENAIKFYTSVQAKRAGMALLKGSQYQTHLTESLTHVKDCCYHLESQANLSFNHRMIGDNERMFSDLSAIRQGNKMTQVGLNALLQEQKVQTAGMIWIEGMFNQFLSFLNDKERNWPPHSPNPSRSVTPQPVSVPLITPRELWSRLSIPNIDETDLEYVLSRAEEMFNQDQGRAQQIVSMPLFRSWIDSSSSAKLLVHGNFRAAGSISPLSTLCTVLARTFRQVRQYISLVFFCGRHLVWDDHHGGVTLIRSLIAQLLRQLPSQHLNLDAQAVLKNIYLEDARSLCNLFQYLIGQTQMRTPIVCIIDGINLYETDDYIEDMSTVVLSLIDLVYRSGPGSCICFKLLLTSPIPTTDVRKIFDEDVNPCLLHLEGIPIPERSVQLNIF